MRVGIDEARRHVQSCCVDPTPRRGRPEISDRRNSVSIQGHVGEEPRVARSVQDAPALDQQVEWAAVLGRNRRSQEEAGNGQ